MSLVQPTVPSTSLPEIKIYAFKSYVRLATTSIVDSVQLTDSITLDVDEFGGIVGIETVELF